MKFSIITCTYNSAKFLQKNIDSVKNQSFGDFEHIFIDGFSSDRTIEIIKKYQSEFPERVKLFQFEPKGIANAMNKGIEKAQGEYLIHLHSDDSFYDNDVLKSVNDFLIQRKNPDWIYGKISVIKESGGTIGIFPKKLFLQQTYKSFFGKYILNFVNFIPHQTVFIKKSVFDKFGYFKENLTSKMDFEMWLRIKNSTSWFFFSIVISNYMIRSEAQSSGKKNELENISNLVKVQKEYLRNSEFWISRIINYFLYKKNKTVVSEVPVKLKMKFSIITCTYNSAKFLQKNIDSVKNQSFGDFEHIFIDGFSSDRTIEIIKKYQSEFPERVKLFQFEPKGIANAMNKGIEKAQGEYLIHLHSDDSFYDNDVLEDVLKFIINNRFPDMVYGKARFINAETGNSCVIPYRKIYQKMHFWLLSLTNYIPHQTVFLQKDVFKKFGPFDEKYKNSMDYEYWLRLTKAGTKGLFINEILCNFLIRRNSQSASGRDEHAIILPRYIKNKFLLKILIAINSINKKRALEK